MKTRYRGKYPNRIKAIWTNRKPLTDTDLHPNYRPGMFVQTNEGRTYQVTTRDKLKLGDELTNTIIIKEII